MFHDIRLDDVKADTSENVDFYRVYNYMGHPSLQSAMTRTLHACATFDMKGIKLS